MLIAESAYYIPWEYVFMPLLDRNMYQSQIKTIKKEEGPTPFPFWIAYAACPVPADVFAFISC